MSTTDVAQSTDVGANRSNSVMVWDPLVRIFHWSLALAFITAFLTGDEATALHLWAGYAAGGLVVFRIFWGFVGTKHARFVDFIFGPVTTLSYLVDLIRFRARRYLGHNPAAAAMIFALLTAMSATVWSGMELYAAEENKGPLASTFVQRNRIVDRDATRLILVSVGEREGRGNGRGQEQEHGFWEEAHEAMANLTLALVLLHIGGVVFSSLAHRENLIKSMITGRKRLE